MSEVPRASGGRIVLFAVVVGVSTVLLALVLPTLTPGWSHRQRGAVLGAWIVLCLCMAPMARRLGARAR